MYNENHKTLLKEIQEDPEKRNIPSHRLEDRIAETSVLLKMVCRSSGIPVKISMTFFAVIEKNHPKIYMESQKTSNNQNSLEKEEQNGGLTPPDVQSHYKATVTKTVCQCRNQMRRPMEQTEQRSQK